MKKIKTVVSLAAILAVVAIIGQVKAGPVTLSALTSKVQEAIKSQSAIGSVIGIDETTENGEKSYDVVFTKNGVERTLTFSEEGKVIRTQVFETNLPPVVRQIVSTEFKGIKPVEYYRVTKDEEPYYDLEIPGGNATNSLSVAENGRWWSLDIGLADVPAPVRTIIERELGAGDYDSICKTKEDGKLYYEAETTAKDGHDINLNITPDGNLIFREDEVTLAQASPAAQKTIRAQFKEDQIDSITKHAENGGVTFEVEAHRDGKTIEMSVGRAGRIRQQTAH
jgi:uncharacterized membrane protein YkoI